MDMDKIPFLRSYDFFAYLSTGFLVLCGLGYANNAAWMTQSGFKVGLIWGGLGIILSCTIGQAISTVAGWIFERVLVRPFPPERTLFAASPPRDLVYALFLANRCSPLPKETQESLRKAYRTSYDNCGLVHPSARDLYLLARSVQGRLDESANRLVSVFLNYYGFARNMAFVFLFLGLVLWLFVHWDWLPCVPFLVIAFLMFCRSYYFYYRYKYEVCMAYVCKVSERRAEALSP